jgi:hypothetical protein
MITVELLTGHLPEKRRYYTASNFIPNKILACFWSPSIAERTIGSAGGAAPSPDIGVMRPGV